EGDGLRLPFGYRTCVPFEPTRRGSGTLVRSIASNSRFAALTLRGENTSLESRDRRRRSQTTPGLPTCVPFEPTRRGSGTLVRLTVALAEPVVEQEEALGQLQLEVGWFDPFGQSPQHARQEFFHRATLASATSSRHAKVAIAFAMRR